MKSPVGRAAARVDEGEGATLGKNGWHLDRLKEGVDAWCWGGHLDSAWRRDAKWFLSTLSLWGTVPAWCSKVRLGTSSVLLKGTKLLVPPLRSVGWWAAPGLRHSTSDASVFVLRAGNGKCNFYFASIACSGVALLLSVSVAWSR